MINDTEYRWIRELVVMAQNRDIEINEITVSPTLYEILKDGAALSSTYSGGALELRFGKVLIKKRPCIRCCQHE